MNGASSGRISGAALTARRSFFVLLVSTLIHLHLDRAELLGVRLRGLPHAGEVRFAAVRVDRRRHGRVVEGGVEDGEVDEDPAGGEAAETSCSESR